MNHEQAAEVLYTINEVYPKFELTERKLKVLTPVLLQMDFDGVMERLKEHIAKKSFVPTIAEIAVYPAPENKVLQKINQFEREAAQNPPTKEQRRQFEKKLQTLLKKDEQNDT
ncbi:hypothetical protein [Halalkalibacter oceani]|uniref:hypothetical protein n=1 Tax=Halalkalibacter oceani TaxID=1653776 RepID=UPI003392F5EE